MLLISLQAKTAFEADIDCIQEVADFYRFGIHYAKVVYKLAPFQQYFVHTVLLRYL